MVSFEDFHPIDGVPIYQQILLHIKRGAVAGTITDGDELPSRRVLSALLGINPNTVQKAFKLLEDEQLIASHSGAKSYMTLTPDHIEQIREELLSEEIRGIARSLRQMGIGKEDALKLISRYWEEEV